MRIEGPALVGEPPDPISVRTADFAAGTVFPPQRQPWGKLLYALRGVAEFDIEGARYLSPPAYAIWVPPNVLHQSQTRHGIRYAATYVREDLCVELPDTPCTLALNPLIKAIVADFSERAVSQPRTPEDRRLAAVLIDRLRLARRHESYLPATDDGLLAPLLAALQKTPGDRRSLAELARVSGTTERTVSRRCRETLGMSFNDWRQRLKLLTAITLIEEGCPIQSVARQLGYSNTSAFIAMFRQLTNLSPTELRRQGTAS